MFRIVAAPSDDPCDNYSLLAEPWRHVTAGRGTHSDKDLASGWYALQYDGDWAVIPHSPLKVFSSNIALK